MRAVEREKGRLDSARRHADEDRTAAMKAKEDAESSLRDEIERLKAKLEEAKATEKKSTACAVM